MTQTRWWHRLATNIICSYGDLPLEIAAGVRPSRSVHLCDGRQMTRRQVTTRPAVQRLRRSLQCWSRRRVQRNWQLSASRIGPSGGGTMLHLRPACSPRARNVRKLRSAPLTPLLSRRTVVVAQNTAEALAPTNVPPRAKVRVAPPEAPCISGEAEGGHSHNASRRDVAHRHHGHTSAGRDSRLPARGDRQLLPTDLGVAGR
jgi:hypothetical protein